MKKFYSLLLALGLVFGGVISANAYTAPLSDGNAHQLDDSGGGTVADPVRVYRLVRFAENNLVGVQLSAGDVVVWDCNSDDGVTVGLVTTVASADAVAGVIVSPTIPTADSANTAVNSIGKRNWGYMQTSGYCGTVNIKSGSATVGAALRASDTARYATASTVKATGNSQRLFGFSYDASSDGQSEAYVDLR